jgi:outer membrane protein OmpA-like peptidoglycan-associated protein
VVATPPIPDPTPSADQPADGVGSVRSYSVHSQLVNSNNPVTSNLDASLQGLVELLSSLDSLESGTTATQFLETNGINGLTTVTLPTALQDGVDPPAPTVSATESQVSTAPASPPPASSPAAVTELPSSQTPTSGATSMVMPVAPFPDVTAHSREDIRFILARLEAKVSQLQRKIDEPTTLINPLLPLITELLSIKNTEFHESLLQALTPLIDQAIHLRNQEASAQMGAAIAEILPAAIRHEIETAPTSFAKAIAPELALALQEQSRLDPDAIAQTLGPQMGEAIKTQIVVEKDAMVDALYPVIGNTISKYMAEVVKSINAKVEDSLSPSGVRRKIQAKLQGVSEAELILKESMGFSIQAILLIHKASGLVMRDLQPASSFQIEADMLAGMLTAIRSFVGECMTQPGNDSELHEIEYNTSKIIVEVAGYCYLAVIVKGEPSQELIQAIRQSLSQIVLKAGKGMAHYDGDPSLLPASIDINLQQILQVELQRQSKPKRPVMLLILLGLTLASLGIWGYRAYIARQVEAKATDALNHTPELAIYNIEPQVQWGKLILQGRLPNAYLRQRAEGVVKQVAGQWPLRNQIVTVQAPAEPTATAGEVERITWLFNQRPGVAITTKHPFGSNRVDVTGVVTDFQDSLQLSNALERIPGINKVINTVQVQPVLETQLLFSSNSDQLESSAELNRLEVIRQFLDQNPGVSLKIIGHTDPTGEPGRNQTLSIERARQVEQLLLARGISPNRLRPEGSSTPPPGLSAQHPLRLGRVVRFEVFISSKK